MTGLGGPAGEGGGPAAAPLSGWDMVLEVPESGLNTSLFREFIRDVKDDRSRWVSYLSIRNEKAGGGDSENGSGAAAVADRADVANAEVYQFEASVGWPQVTFNVAAGQAEFRLFIRPDVGIFIAARIGLTSYGLGWCARQNESIVIAVPLDILECVVEDDGTVHFQCDQPERAVLQVQNADRQVINFRDISPSFPDFPLSIPGIVTRWTFLDALEITRLPIGGAPAATKPRSVRFFPVRPEKEGGGGAALQMLVQTTGSGGSGRGKVPLPPTADPCRFAISAWTFLRALGEMRPFGFGLQAGTDNQGRPIATGDRERATLGTFADFFPRVMLVTAVMNGAGLGLVWLEDGVALAFADQETQKVNWGGSAVDDPWTMKATAKFAPVIENMDVQLLDQNATADISTGIFPAAKPTEALRQLFSSARVPLFTPTHFLMPYGSLMTFRTVAIAGDSVSLTAALANAWRLAPQLVALRPGEAAVQFTVLTDGNEAAGAGWKIDGPGTIDANGLYTPPATLEKSCMVVVTATQRLHVAHALVLLTIPGPPMCKRQTVTPVPQG